MAKKLHGAALAAHNKRLGKSGGKKGHGRKGNPAAKNPPHRRRRRNPKITFVQALGKVAGGAAAMFGSGVVTTLAAAKLQTAMSAPAAGTTAPTQASAAWTYVPSAVVALLGAAVATRMPIVGAGITAGAAAPFVLPVASRMLMPSSPAAAPAASPATVAALRAVAMGSGGAWRALNTARDLRAVQMGRVQMGRHAYAT